MAHLFLEHIQALPWSGRVNIELTPDDLREVDSAFSKINVQGVDHPEHLQRRSAAEVHLIFGIDLLLPPCPAPDTLA